MHTYPMIATPPSGAELNPMRGLFSVIVPEATTNLIINPSPQRDIAGYSLSGAGLINRTTTTQRRGVFAVECIPSFANSGVLRSMVVTSGLVYTFSADVKGLAGRKYYLQLGTGTTIVTKRFVATGRWQRMEATITATTSALFIQVLSANGYGFWTDGWQVENKPYATTYVDGSMRGLSPDRADYYWTGIPYASPSTRLASTRTGGRMLRLDTGFGFRLAAIVGLSSLLLAHQSLPLSMGGSIYQGSSFPASQAFTLSGVIEGRDPADIDRKRSALNIALSPLLTPDAEPATLIYHPSDDERVIGDDVELLAIWNPAAGEISARHQVRLDLEFTLFMPAIVQGCGGAELSEQSAIPSAENVLYRAPNGQWQRLGTSAVASATYIRTLAPRASGGIYAGGAGLINGTINYLAQWNGTAWSLVGPGAPNNAVWGLATDSQGRVYAVGAFTSIGGVAANRVARYDPTTNSWTALGAGITGGIPVTIAIAPNGDVYVGGSFTTAGGVAVNNIAKYTPSTGLWSALGSGTNNQVLTIVPNTEGQIFVGGQFTAAGGAASTNRIARWNPNVSAWAPMGIGVTAGNNVLGMTIGPDNRLYIFGDFTSIGGVAAKAAAIFNGTSYEPLGVGFDTGSSLPYAGAFDQQGILYIVGSITALGDGSSVPDGVVRWTGGAIIPGDIDVANSSIRANAVLPMPDGSVYIGFEGVTLPPQSAVASGLTLVTNQSTTRTFPTIELQAGTAAQTKLFQVVNQTTGKGLYFNYTMQPGERITMYLQPDNIEIISTFRGNIIGAVAAGSQLAEMYLLPGPNEISLFMDRNDVTATIQWPIMLSSLHDAAWR